MNQRLAPRFEVEKLDGTIEKTVYQYTITYLKDEDGEIVRDEEGRKIIQTKQRTSRAVQVDAGWMVYFPRGHSVHITDPKEMERLGFFSNPEIVDMNSEAEEDAVPQIDTSLKSRVERTSRAQRSRRGRAATGTQNAEVAET